MAKYTLRIKARELRQAGISIKTIARSLHVSKSSISRWVRDVILSEEQLSVLAKSELKGKEIGRFRSVFIKRNNRLKVLESFVQAGIKTISILNDRELLLVGLALYAGEGGKRDRRVEFCNSDPRMIKFLMCWLRQCFNVNAEDFRCVVGINQIHSSREKIVKSFWSNVTQVPLDQFRKTNFKKVNNKKVYENLNNHYGTLTILVAKSTTTYYKIMGLLEAMYGSIDGVYINGNVAQW